MKKIVIALAVIIALLGGIYGALVLFAPAQATQKPAVVRLEREPLSIQEIHRLVNAERVKAGVTPLVIDSRLTQGAQIKADELASGNYLESNRHKNKSGKSGFTYSGELAPECQKPGGGENLVWDAISEEQTVQLWMNSTAHREAMLGADSKIVGYAVKNEYVVQHLC